MRIESLDLHGLILDEAMEKTTQNLQWCINNGVDVLDINHGKGHHSNRNFSVIKKEVRKMLKRNPLLKEAGYKVVYGESKLPIALTFDEGHTLVVARGMEKEYIGGQKVREKNLRIFSSEARKRRQAIKAEKRKNR